MPVERIRLRVGGRQWKENTGHKFMGVIRSRGWGDLRDPGTSFEILTLPRGSFGES